MLGSSVIALSTVGGLLVLVLSLALLSYCYRYRERKEKHSNGKPKSMAQKHVVHSIQRTPVDNGHVGIIPWRAGSHYPRMGHHQPRQSQKIYLTKSGTTGSRIYVAQHRPQVQQHPFTPYYMPSHHSSMPHLRLGTYTPKVIEGMSFNPESVRHLSHENYFEIASPHIDKHYHEKISTKNGSRWREKAYEEKTGTVIIEDDEDDGLYITRNSLQIPMKGVVIAKVTNNQYGPLSTSTPRVPDTVLVKPSNKADSDSGVGISEKRDSRVNNSVINVQ